MQHGERERSLQVEVARLRKALEDTENARCVLLAELRASERALAAANARADAAEALAEDRRKARDIILGDAQENREALAAARRECEVLISPVMHLRLVGTQMATFIEEQMPLFGGASSEFGGEGEPREILNRWRKADKLADKSYGPALGAPAAAAGEDSK